MMLYKIAFVVVCFVSVESVFQSQTDELIKETFNIIKECNETDVFICLKEKLIKMIEEIPREFQLSAGIAVKENVKGKRRLFRNLDEVDLPENKLLRSQVLNEVLLEKITEFVKNHMIEMKIPEDTIYQYRRSFQEGRKKKRKSMMPYLLLFKAKAVALGAFFVKFVSLIAFKALLLAKLALLLTMSSGIKRLSDYSPRHPPTFYESPSYESNWRRLVKDDTNIPFSAQVRSTSSSYINSNKKNFY